MLEKGVRNVDFFLDVTKIFQTNNVAVKERLYTVEATFNTICVNLPTDKEIEQLLCVIPNRDLLKMTLLNDSEDSFVATNKFFDRNNYLKYIEENDKNDDIKVNIQID